MIVEVLKMKKLIYLLMILIFLSCEVPTGTNIVTYLPEDPIDDPEPLPEIEDIIMLLYDGLDLRIYDGENFKIIYTSEHIKFGGDKTISIDDYLYRFDSQGIVTESFRLNGIPEALLWDNGDSYNFSEYFIYKNGDSIGNFFFDIKSASMNSRGELIAIDKINGLHNITGSTVPFRLYNGLYISDINYSSKTACINGLMVSFHENYFYNSRWQQCGDKFYSNFGMEFYGTTFIENSTALQDFKSETFPYVIEELANAQKPSLHPAGQNYEHSEWVAYFIESTSGHLIKYTPSIDSYDILPKLYWTNNIMSDGNLIAESLNPVWIENKMYFHHDGSIKVYDPVIGSVNIFSKEQEVWEW